MRKFVLWVATLAAAFASSQASAATLADPFTIVFGNTCMLHFYSQDTLRHEMAANAEQLPPDKAAFFLGGGTGTAWVLPEDAGGYVVALRDDNFCAVYARHADVVAAHLGFKSLVASSPPSLEAKELDKSQAGPNTETLKSVAYSWSRPEDKTELVFILTTSSESAPMVQAMASVALSKKEP